jgi:hypothetical protein
MQLCDEDDGVVRVLEYHIPGDSFAGKLAKKLLMDSLSGMTVVCVDGRDLVTSSQLLEF